MEFNKENYPAIKEACSVRKEIEFTAPIFVTAFPSDKPLPSEWTGYAPCLLPPSGYAQVFAYAGNDAKGELTKLELLVHLDEGKLFYKSAENNSVAFKFTWTN